MKNCVNVANDCRTRLYIAQVRGAKSLHLHTQVPYDIVVVLDKVVNEPSGKQSGLVHCGRLKQGNLVKTYTSNIHPVVDFYSGTRE